jgi:hypothetical protein
MTHQHTDAWTILCTHCGKPTTYTRRLVIAQGERDDGTFCDVDCVRAQMVAAYRRARRASEAA